MPTEKKTVSLAVYVSTVGAFLVALAFLAGFRSAEINISRRLSALEEGQVTTRVQISSLTGTLQDHIAWSSARSGQLDELNVAIARLQEQQRYLLERDR